MSEHELPIVTGSGAFPWSRYEAERDALAAVIRVAGLSPTIAANVRAVDERMPCKVESLVTGENWERTPEQLDRELIEPVAAVRAAVLEVADGLGIHHDVASVLEADVPGRDLPADELHRALMAALRSNDEAIRQLWRWCEEHGPDESASRG